MKFEIVEEPDGWAIRCDGVEVSRCGDQDEAFADIAERLRECGTADASHSLGVRYLERN